MSGGPLTVDATAGVSNFQANFTTLNTALTGYTIQATSPGLTSVTTNTINVTAASATHLVMITSPPSSVSAGSSFGFVVAAEDQFGNIDSNYHGQMTATVPAGVSLNGNTTQTPSNGEGNFSGLTLGTITSPVSISVSAPGLTGLATSAVTEPGVGTNSGSGSGGGSGGSGGTGTGGGSGGTSSASLVTLTNVELVKKKHKVTEVLLVFSGALNSTEASTIDEYGLVMAGKKNSFTAKGAKPITLLSAAYNAAENTVTLTPRKPFKVTKPVQLVVHGTGSPELHDSQGRLIDGDHNGTAGGDAQAVITPHGASISAMSTAAIDAIVELEGLASLTKPRKS